MTEIDKIYNKDIDEKNNYILMKIPFVKNIHDYLMNIHKNTCHWSFDKFRNVMLNKGIYYKGIVKDLKIVLNNCSICKIKNSKIDLKKRNNLNLLFFINLWRDI